MPDSRRHGTNLSRNAAARMSGASKLATEAHWLARRDRVRGVRRITVRDETADTTCFPLFVSGATGNQEPKSIATRWTFNAATGAMGLVGALTTRGQLPEAADTYDLGSPALHWNQLHADLAHLYDERGVVTAAKGSLDVDGYVLGLKDNSTFVGTTNWIVDDLSQIIGGTTFVGTTTATATLDINGASCAAINCVASNFGASTTSRVTLNNIGCNAIGCYVVGLGNHSITIGTGVFGQGDNSTVIGNCVNYLGVGAQTINITRDNSVVIASCKAQGGGTGTGTIQILAQFCMIQGGCNPGNGQAAIMECSHSAGMVRGLCENGQMDAGQASFTSGQCSGVNALLSSSGGASSAVGLATGTNAIVHANGPQSRVHGRANASQVLRADGEAASATGRAENGDILAQGDASAANGKTSGGGDIDAQDDGGWCHAHLDTATGCTSTAPNAGQFGPGQNDTERSWSVGQNLLLEGDGGINIVMYEGEPVTLEDELVFG